MNNHSLKVNFSCHISYKYSWIYWIGSAINNKKNFGESSISSFKTLVHLMNNKMNFDHYCAYHCYKFLFLFISLSFKAPYTTTSLNLNNARSRSFQWNAAIVLILLSAKWNFKHPLVKYRSKQFFSCVVAVYFGR